MHHNIVPEKVLSILLTVEVQFRCILPPECPKQNLLAIRNQKTEQLLHAQDHTTVPLPDYHEYEQKSEPSSRSI